MKTLILLFALGLAGCGAQPAPEFFGTPSQEFARDGYRFVLFQKDKRFEIIRLGYAPAGAHEGLRETMVTLVEEETGCKIRPSTLRGDSGEMRGSLTCPRTKAAG